VAVSPDGQSVYVTNNLDDNVSQYDVGADGTLSPKSPATVAAGESPSGIVASPARPLPTSIKDCLNGGWRNFGFRNVGKCIKFVTWTRICDALERKGHQPPFCPPAPPHRN
jgi:hypothetical protein